MKFNPALFLAITLAAAGPIAEPQTEANAVAESNSNTGLSEALEKTDNVLAKREASRYFRWFHTSRRGLSFYW